MWVLENIKLHMWFTSVFHYISIRLHRSRSLAESGGWLRCVILFIEMDAGGERSLNRHWRGGDGVSGEWLTWCTCQSHPPVLSPPETPSILRASTQSGMAMNWTGWVTERGGSWGPPSLSLIGSRVRELEMVNVPFSFSSLWLYI